MTKFEMNFTHAKEPTYDNKIRLEIALSQRPTAEDYKKMLDVVAILNDLKDVYLPIVVEKK